MAGRLTGTATARPPPTLATVQTLVAQEFTTLWPTFLTAKL